MVNILDGVIVLDFSQYLAGPSAGLRLADLGATVIKVEKPGIGEAYRQKPDTDLRVAGENYIFHVVNRNKDSIAVDLKDLQQRKKLEKLIKTADVMLISFRPDATKRLQLDYESIRRMNPGIIYGEITGFGHDSSWKDRPGQDLLIQSIAGIGWLNGNADQPPTIFGLAAADQFAGQHMVQAVLAALYRKSMTGQGALIEISLLESILDVAFEAFTAYLNDHRKLPERSMVNHSNVSQGAPYGIYQTADGYIALAMSPITTLGQLLGCTPLASYTDAAEWFTKRDEIKTILKEFLLTGTTEHWLSLLEPADIWCADVYDWDRLISSEAFAALDMTLEVPLPEGKTLVTTRCPITIDGEHLVSAKPAPLLGQDNEKYL